MLITSAVVPGPPAVVAELMGSAANELADLREAADRAVWGVLSALSAWSAGSSTPVQLVVVGPGEPAELKAAGPVSFAGFGLGVVVPAIVEGQPGDDGLPTPIMVARYLASRDIAAHPGHARLWAAARWITTSGQDATALGEQLGASSTRVGLILVADGASCHGPKAPRAQDDRAWAYDDSVCAALASGQPSRLAGIDAGLGEELGANGYQVWPVLVAAARATAASFTADIAETADIADTAGPSEASAVGEVLWSGAPYGVGWAVASWRRS